MGIKNQHIIIVAGEVSGDHHAANLVKSIQSAAPSISFSGLGGKQMANAGVNIYYDLTKIAVVGFWEVLTHYAEFKKVFNLILEKVKETKTKTVILVDYPGFNLRLAKKLKELNVKVIYYISPQVWAWKKNRVFDIQKHIDLMLVLFKFEEEFYKPYQINTVFSGHPLIDQVKATQSREQFLEQENFHPDKITFGILPGSRHKEIERHLPIMLKSAECLYKEFPQSQFLIAQSPTIDDQTMTKYTSAVNFPFKCIQQNHYNLINATNACMVASGTATLEVALLEKPMVVVYKTSFLTWLIAKFFVKVKNIGLVNVVAGKRIVPECIQYEANPAKISSHISKFITNEIYLADIKIDLKKVRTLLGEHGASEKAAGLIIQFLNQ